MKTLLILLLPLLTFGQRQTFENHLYNSSGWYNEFGEIKDGSIITKNSCYFSVVKYDDCIELNILSEERILTPIFILTHRGNIVVSITKLKVKNRLNKENYYAAEIDLNYDNKNLWGCLDAGIKQIAFHTSKMRTITLIIDDNLTKLKDYAK
jgi:hypothetical protein